LGNDNNNKYVIERSISVQLKGLLHFTYMRVTLALGVDGVLSSGTLVLTSTVAIVDFVVNSSAAEMGKCV
jgi:hypothetical protein